ncbi:MAG: lipopolysaccharide biosynthesis protein [Patescibacteria group bacterium]|nr:lipopolysaccharide biosynthesis protein [Actinomycetota bacterium]MCL5438475.1 lipopolysaccharide biosynthesis protein [Patescibacteria group bacterium]
MGYTREAIKGISWLGAFRLFTRVLSFLRTIIVARILSPTQFGVYGIAALVLSLVEILTETGINVFLVQNKDNVDKYINTAWIVSILRGVLISLVIFLSSFFVSAFFRTPDALPLLMLVAVVPLIRGFINPSVARFQKDLQFHKEFYYRSGIFLVETIVSIVLVIIMKNPIALIYSLIAGAIFEVIISFWFVKPVPIIEFNKKIFKEIVSHCKWITGTGIFGYLFQNGDNVVVGRVLGTSSLGIYDMAYSISTLPLNEISDIVARVTFPVYVKISDDKKRLRRAYIKTILLTALFTLPILLLFLLFPEQLILIFLGANWIQATGILRVLAVFAMISILGSPSGAVFYSVKKQKYLTVISAISFVVMITSIFPLINRFGLIGAGIAATLGSLATLPFMIYYLIKVFR